MKKIARISQLLAVLAFFSTAAYSQSGEKDWQWPVAGLQVGEGILCKPQQYLGKELNFGDLFIGAPLGTEVRAPEEGTLVQFSIIACSNLSTSCSYRSDQESFDAMRAAILEQEKLPVPPDYVNGYVGIQLQDGRKIYIHGLRGSVKMKTGMLLRKGDLLGTVAYGYKEIKEPHISLSVSTPQGKVSDPMTPFGLATTFKAPEEIVQPDSLTAAQAGEDLGVLLDSYRQLYPSLREVVTPEQLAAFESEAKNAFAHGISYDDFYALVQKSTALVHDSHLAVLSQNKKQDQGALHVPHIFPGMVDSVLQVRAAEEGFERYVGRQLVSIDGIPADSLVATVRKEYVKEYDLNNRSLVDLKLFQAWNYFYLNDVYRPRTTRIVFADGEMLEDRWGPVRQFKGLTPSYSKAFVQRMTEHYNNPWHFKMLDDSTAYLALRSFSLYRTQVDAIQDSLAAHRDAANLIFDVRDNPGGEDEVVRRIAGWFLDGPSVPLKSCSKVLSNTTYPILAHSKNYSADMEIFTEYTPVEGKEGFYAGYDSARVLQPDSVFHFGARLYFLTNEASVSAASLFPSILVRNHRAVTVGRETGTAYHFMTALKFADMILPHSWIQVRVPLVQCWFDETVMERTPFGRGLLPDYEVPLTAEEYYAEIPDPVLAKAQELIAAGQYLGPDPFAGVDARSSAVCLFRRLWLWSLLGGLAAAVLCGIFLLRKRFPRARLRS